MKVGIFGGSFNPPHIGHVLAVTHVLCTADIDRIIVIPTFQHPFAKKLAPFEDRMVMSELAMGWIPGVEISRIEETLGGESRTVRTLEALQDANPAWAMRLIMGSDVVREADKWYSFARVRALAPPLELGRAGFLNQVEQGLLPNVSSTEVRARIAAGDWDALVPLVPRQVIAYVRERNLYGDGQ